MFDSIKVKKVRRKREEIEFLETSYKIIEFDDCT